MVNPANSFENMGRKRIFFKKCNCLKIILKSYKNQNTFISIDDIEECFHLLLSEKESRRPKNFIEKSSHPLKSRDFQYQIITQGHRKTKKKVLAVEESSVPYFRKYLQLMELNLRNQNWMVQC